ncbi:MAG TPA: hypothetical protein VMV19_04680 [Xanthobacteraceae bacterium]|nr:hypothetical protein [Xanthobacteraceae bacterium]
MATTELPLIAPADYDAFRKLLGNELSATYQEWLQAHQDETRDCLRRGATASVSEIPVDPDEFARFCGTRGGHCNLANLLRFTIEKARGYKY